MSEPTPPPVAGDALDGAPAALSPEAVEAVLADFRAWLHENAAAAPPAGPAPVPPAPDLHTLLGQFTALRHEINLQTKATRAQQEQNADTLRQLSQALEALHKVPEEVDEPDTDEALRPLLKAMVDVYDALALAEREVRRVQKKVLPALDEMTTDEEEEGAPQPAEEEPEPPLPAQQAVPFWGRWFGRQPAETADELHRQHRLHLRELRQRLAAEKHERLALERELHRAGKAADGVRRAMESVATGYGMSLQRLERALQQQGLEPIPTVGERFDPERMEVVEVVIDSGKPAGEVVEEVRRGYFWRERVFRYAQVRVARS
jgi:molecular chaperone GrpE